MLKHLIVLCASLMVATPASSKPIKIVTDIAPVYSLVSFVLGDTDNLTLLLDAGASPHDFALKPSQASALQDADFVIFTGLALTPWLEKPLQTLAKNSVNLALLNLPDTVQLEMRKSNIFEDDHDHDHGDHIDPHAWMDPQNAIIWLEHIAEVLSAYDIDNAQQYTLNSKRAQMEILNVSEQISKNLSAHKEDKVVFFHDAYQYFESRFKLHAVGAVTLADDAKITPKQLRAVEGLFKDNDVQCVLTEPATKSDWVNSLAGRDIAQAELDPLGANIPMDPFFYVALLQTTAAKITECLAP